jgi:hypothetical protein
MDSLITSFTSSSTRWSMSSSFAEEGMARAPLKFANGRGVRRRLVRLTHDEKDVGRFISRDDKFLECAQEHCQEGKNRPI